MTLNSTWARAILDTLHGYQQQGFLCDLTVTANDGSTLSVHSCVLAAAAPSIYETLSRSEGATLKLACSRYGIQAMVSYAYTGVLDLRKCHGDELYQMMALLGLPLSVLKDDTSSNSISATENLGSAADCHADAVADDTETIQCQVPGPRPEKSEGYAFNKRELVYKTSLSTKYDAVTPDSSTSIIFSAIPKGIDGIRHKGQKTKGQNESDMPHLNISLKECHAAESESTVSTMKCEPGGSDGTEADDSVNSETPHVADCNGSATSTAYGTRTGGVTHRSSSVRECGAVCDAGTVGTLRTVKGTTGPVLQDRSSTGSLPHDNETSCFVPNPLACQSDSETKLKGASCEKVDNPLSEQSLKCEVCLKTYKRKASFELHTLYCGRRIDDSKSRQFLHESDLLKRSFAFCEVCTRSFSSQSAMQKHKRLIHEGIKDFSCEICSKKFSSKILLTNHTALHTGVKAFQCRYCGKSFRTGDARRCHEKKCRDRLEMYNSEGHRYSCDSCQETFECKRDYDLHNQRVHSDLARRVCTLCGSTFAIESALKQHKKLVHCERNVSCSKCDKIFKTKYHLKEHCERAHSGDKAACLCTVCGKGFTNKRSLRTHEEIHTARARTFSCGTCGKSFMTKNMLKQHEIRHSSERPFTCSICGRGFRRKADCLQHERRHTGNVPRPFKCETCAKAYESRWDLNEHSRSHTGERPYRCTLCPTTYVFGSKLKIHYRRKHGVFDVPVRKVNQTANSLWS